MGQQGSNGKSNYVMDAVFYTVVVCGIVLFIYGFNNCSAKLEKWHKDRTSQTPKV